MNESKHRIKNGISDTALWRDTSDSGAHLCVGSPTVEQLYLLRRSLTGWEVGRGGEGRADLCGAHSVSTDASPVLGTLAFRPYPRVAPLLKPGDISLLSFIWEPPAFHPSPVKKVRVWKKRMRSSEGFILLGCCSSSQDSLVGALLNSHGLDGQRPSKAMTHPCQIECELVGPRNNCGVGSNLPEDIWPSTKWFSGKVSVQPILSPAGLGEGRQHPHTSSEALCMGNWVRYWFLGEAQAHLLASR